MTPARHMQTHVFLLGFMGSGKSYWGDRLATYFQQPFIDLDHRIETAEQQTIADIFARQGEMGFRALEQKHLHALANLPPSIIALGGGAPCFFDNMLWINQHGRSFYLQVPVDILIPRLQGKISRRPLLAQLPMEEWPAFLEEMSRQRAPYYERAHQTIVYDGDDAAFFTQLCAAAFPPSHDFSPS